MPTSAAKHLQTLESFILNARSLIETDLTAEAFVSVLYILADGCGPEHLSPEPIFVLKENSVSCLEIDFALKSLEVQGLMAASGDMALSQKGTQLIKGGNTVFRKRMIRLWKKAFRASSSWQRVKNDLVAATCVISRCRSALRAFNPETQNFILTHLSPCAGGSFRT